MRIVLVVNNFPDEGRLHYGLFNQRTVRELSKHVQLTVIVPMALKPGRKRLVVEEFEGIPLIRIAAPVIPEMPRLTLQLYYWFVRSPLRTFLSHAQLVHSIGMEFAGLLAGVLVKRQRYYHITQFINDINCLKGSNIETYPFLNVLKSNLKGIICNSKALELKARQLFPHVKQLKTIYRGTDLSLFRPDGPKPIGLPEKSSVNFIYLGGIPFYKDRIYGRNTKGGLTLMEAWKSAEDELRRNNSTLIFGGPEADGQIVRSWREGLKFPDQVLLTGTINPMDVPHYLRGADVILIPSMEEGCPNLLFEAFASGRAVFGSDIGPLAEIIENGENGLILKAGDVKIWKEAIVSFSNKESLSLLKTMGAASRRKAEMLFDIRISAKQLVDFYQDVLFSERF